MPCPAGLFSCRGPLRRAGGQAEGATEGGPAWKGQGLQGRAGAPQLGLGTPWRPSSTGGSPPGGQRPGTLAAPAGSDGRRGAEPGPAGCHARMFLLREPGCSSSPIPASQMGWSPQGGVQSRPWAGSRAQAGEGAAAGSPRATAAPVPATSYPPPTRVWHSDTGQPHRCLQLLAIPRGVRAALGPRCRGLQRKPWPRSGLTRRCGLRSGIRSSVCGSTLAGGHFSESRGPVFCRLDEESGSRSSSRP